MSSATVPTCSDRLQELKLGSCEQPAASLQAQTLREWVSAFARSLALACSPSSVCEFIRDLDINDRLLSRLGWGLLCVVPMLAVFAYVDSGTIQGANPWIKPIKFCLSFSSFVWTVSLFFQGLQLPRWQNDWSRRAIALSITVEMLALFAQAWRSAQPHVAGPFDQVIAQTTVAMVSVNTAIVVVLFALFCTRKVAKYTDAPMVAAIRFSIAIFLIGNAIGGYMLTRGSHTVGAPDGGPGLPFLNWSTIAGDLRIAHFIAVHAIQILPLFAFFPAQMSPKPSERMRMLLVYASSAILLLIVGWTFAEACLARPLMSLAR